MRARLRMLWRRRNVNSHKEQPSCLVIYLVHKPLQSTGIPGYRTQQWSQNDLSFLNLFFFLLSCALVLHRMHTHDQVQTDLSSRKQLSRHTGACLFAAHLNNHDNGICENGDPGGIPPVHLLNPIPRRLYRITRSVSEAYVNSINGCLFCATWCGMLGFDSE